MSEDRSWMYERLNDNGRLSKRFVNKVQQFLDYAFSQTQLLIGDTAKCPCRRCYNKRFHIREEISLHLCKWGFTGQYHNWIAHGEKDLSVQMGESSGINQRDNENVTYLNMVNDAFGPQYNYDNYAPRVDDPNKEAKEFFELLHASEVPISEGVDMTILKWVAQFLNIKTLHNISVAACDKLLLSSRSLLKEENQDKIPDSMYSLKKMMRKLGLAYQTFDVCVNNCFLYYGGENISYTSCPVCSESRYEPRGNGSNNRKAISRKKLWYFPVSSRLQRLYMSRHTAENMTWHLNCRGVVDKVIHPASAEAWKHFDSMHPSFSAEPRNVRLGLCTDGFTPFGNMSVPYSCWPVFVTPYNLPPDLCMRQEYIFLSLIISGPKSPGKNIDVLLRPLIDELIMLWERGIETYDSFNQQNFVLRASLLWTISDFPAYGMLSQWSTHGRMSCPYCMESTKAFQLKHGRKTTFFDCHRQFLPMDHTFRRNKKDFVKNRVETNPPPNRRSGSEMAELVENLEDAQYGVARQSIDGFGVSHNWTGRSIFWDLPYWSTNLIRHNLDVMHCEKNFFDNIKNTVMDDPEKSKDNINARKDLELLTRRKDLFLKTDSHGRVLKPKATYCLSREQRKLVCEWLRQLRFPDGYASNISRCVQMQQLRLYGMKSHDCHVFMQRLLPIAFRDMIPDNVWGPLVEVSNFFRALCASQIQTSDMEFLERSIVEIICKLEKIFPPAFFDSMEHLVIHLPYEAKVGGPVQYRWMYPFERRMHELKNTAKNKARVEGSIAEAYILSEITFFCSLYFASGVESRRNRLNRNETTIASSANDELSIFQAKGRPIGSIIETRTLTPDEYNAVELYILMNCEEASCWFRAFEEQVCCNLNKEQMELKRSNEFVRWFKYWALSGQCSVDQRLIAFAKGPIWNVKSYKGYIVNGFRFHTETFGQSKRTMNSGVCVKADIGDCNNDTYFYGMLQEIVELNYWGMGRRQSVVLFKCDWYDLKDGTRVHPTYRLVDVNPRSQLITREPFILATQAQQVYYTCYPSQQNTRRRGWWAVCAIKARHIIEASVVTPEDNEVRLDEGEEIFQDDETPSFRLNVDLSSHDLPLELADDEVEYVDNLHGEEEIADGAEEEFDDDEMLDEENGIEFRLDIHSDDESG